MTPALTRSLQALRLLGAALPMACAALGSSAQDFPSKPVRIVVPSGAGGLSDMLARLVGGKLQERVGQPFIIDNRPGGAGAVGLDLTAKAPGDGYTLVMAPSSMTTMPSTMKNLAFDPLKDLVPITKAIELQNVLEASAKAPFRNAREMIAYAKANPGKLNSGTTGLGSTTHLMGELFKQLAGIDIVMVHFKSVTQAYPPLTTGEIDLLIDSASGSLPHIRSGRFVPLVVLSTKPSPVLPGIPTPAELGFTEFVVTAWIGFMTSKGTPADIVNRLNREIVAVLRQPDITEQFQKLGAQVVADTPEQFGKSIAAEIAQWSKVVRDGNLKFE
jgi:tripartite-type tricarboxylate transporter receptor subunit TctC